jgi:hypothetical protein
MCSQEKARLCRRDSGLQLAAFFFSKAVLKKNFFKKGGTRRSGSLGILEGAHSDEEHQDRDGAAGLVVVFGVLVVLKGGWALRGAKPQTGWGLG